MFGFRYNTIRNKFYKHERLCSKKQIDLLFKENKGASMFPLKLVFMPADLKEISPAQAMFVVPKRNFKKAHDRNILKRRMREAYRLNKSGFYELLAQQNKNMLLAFIYTAKKQEDFLMIEAAIKKLLGQAVKSGVERI